MFPLLAFAKMSLIHSGVCPREAAEAAGADRRLRAATSGTAEANSMLVELEAGRWCFCASGVDVDGGTGTLTRGLRGFSFGAGACGSFSTTAFELSAAARSDARARSPLATEGPPLTAPMAGEAASPTYGLVSCVASLSFCANSLIVSIMESVRTLVFCILTQCSPFHSNIWKT
jgi:hypothetical protein